MLAKSRNGLIFGIPIGIAAVVAVFFLYNAKKMRKAVPAALTGGYKPGMVFGADETWAMP